MIKICALRAVVFDAGDSAHVKLQQVSQLLEQDFRFEVSTCPAEYESGRHCIPLVVRPTNDPL